jgi:hypothetical protein
LSERLSKSKTIILEKLETEIDILGDRLKFRVDFFATIDVF